MSEANLKPLRSPSRWPLWSQYVLSLGSIGAALGARWLLNPVIGETAVPFLTVFATLLLLLPVVRPGPFLVATLAGGVGTLVLFMQPRLSLSMAGTAEVVQLGLFLATGGAAALAGWLSRRFESRRDEAERRLSTLTANLPGLVYRRRNAPGLPVELVSGRVQGVVGRPANDLLSGRVSWRDIVHHDDVQRVEEALQGSARERRSYRIEYRVVHTDGTERSVWEGGEPIYDARGDCVAFEGFVMDVTDARRTEQELGMTRARERSYLDHLPVGVWFANDRGELVYGNGAAQDIWGGARMVGPEGYEEYEGYWHGTSQRIRREDWALFRALRGETTIAEVIDIVGFDGIRRTILNSAVPVRDEDETIVGGVVMNLDITELKRAETALKRADQRKDEFLAALAHELRNPLAAMDAATELLAHASALSPARLEAAALTIRRQISMMTRLVDDLLDVSRITRGALELRRGHVELADVVDEAVAALRPEVERRRHAVEISMPDEPLVVQGDSLRLVQVLTNVLSNACAYTDRGGHIDVLVRKEGDEAVLDVRDDGIGIPPEELDRVFEMFSRLESSRDGRHGLGIGLTLSRRIVELHGGRMSAHSDGVGRGSTVSIRLPGAGVVAVPGEPASAEAEPEQRAGRRVLVVDDNVDAADMLAILLEQGGHEVRTAYDGRSAIMESREYRPGAVLLDLGLPDLDGVSVCQAIRSQPWGSEVLIVAVSGWGQEEDKRRTAEAGFDAHLTKPARIEQVMNVLERARGVSEGPSLGGAHGAT